MAARLPALLILITVSVAATLMWGWAGRPVALPDVPGGRLSCVSYSPFSEDELPSDPTAMVPRQRIADDLKLLSHYTNCVRTYSSMHGLAAVPELAAAQGMDVLLGIWIGNNHLDNALEIDAALAAAEAHPKAIRAIIVGNEVLLRRELTADQLMDTIRKVRARTTLPVTYADVWEFWMRNPKVAELTDFVTVHILPFWEDVPIAVERSQAHVSHILDEVRQVFPGRRILIGETGWPSAGRSREGAVPGAVNQARFVREFVVMARDKGMDYNLIEAFDQPWKRRNEGTVGGHWGIFDSLRTLKFPLTGPVSEFPSWPRYAALGTGLAVAAVVWLSLAGARLAAWRWLAVAVLAQATSAVLVLQWRSVLAGGIGPLGLASGIGGLLLAIGGAGLLLALALGARSCTAAHPASAPEVAGWLRAPRRATLAPAILLGGLRLAALFGAAAIAFKLALDPRYLDFPIFAYGLPAAAWLLFGMTEQDDGGRRPEEGWLAIVILLSVPVGLWREGLNIEAVAWNAIALALAWPARRWGWRELRRLWAGRPGGVEACRPQQP